MSYDLDHVWRCLGFIFSIDKFSSIFTVIDGEYIEPLYVFIWRFEKRIHGRYFIYVVLVGGRIWWLSVKLLG